MSAVLKPCDQSNQDHADYKTRAARAEIKKLSKYMTAPDAIALLSCLVSAFTQSDSLATSMSGKNALEYVLDAVAVLEDGEAV